MLPISAAYGFLIWISFWAFIDNDAFVIITKMARVNRSISCKISLTHYHSSISNFHFNRYEKLTRRSFPNHRQIIVTVRVLNHSLSLSNSATELPSLQNLKSLCLSRTKNLRDHGRYGRIRKRKRQCKRRRSDYSRSPQGSQRNEPRLVSLSSSKFYCFSLSFVSRFLY